MDGWVGGWVSENDTIKTNFLKKWLVSSPSSGWASCSIRYCHSFVRSFDRSFVHHLSYRNGQADILNKFIITERAMHECHGWVATGWRYCLSTLHSCITT